MAGQASLTALLMRQAANHRHAMKDWDIWNARELGYGCSNVSTKEL